MSAPLYFRALLLLVTAMPAAAAGFRPDLATLGSVPRHVLPAVSVEKALAAAPRKDRPFDYAVGVETQLSVHDGQWRPLDAQTVTWRLRIASTGARTLSLQLDPFGPPAGAELWLYDAGGRLVHGPYTAADRAPQGIWTPSVRGGEIVIEARMPAAAATGFQLGIARAYHGYRNAKGASAPAKSGSCNIDVACPEGDAWREEIRSAARIEFGTSARFLCSGQLMNTTRQDDAALPYLLTADHCDIGGPGENTAASAVFYFNYETSACRGDPDGDLTQTVLGSTFVADDVESDFTLLRLQTAPSPTYNVYYAGWNVRGDGSPCGASIHHPGGDEKRISLYNRSLIPSRVSIGDGRTVEAWKLQWARGVTEQGSSGGGLWNREHQVVGVLSGGNASCNNPEGDDYFGRLDIAWAGSSALRQALDPDNIGATAIPGRDSDPQTPPPPLDAITSTECGVNPEGSGGGRVPLAVLVPLALAGLARKSSRSWVRMAVP